MITIGRNLNLGWKFVCELKRKWKMETQIESNGIA